jgi:hypothetical protein
VDALSFERAQVIEAERLRRQANCRRRLAGGHVNFSIT